MLLDEPGGADVAEEIRAAERVVASRLVRVEAERVLLRLAVDRPEVERSSPELARGLRDLWTRMDMLEITDGVCALAGRIAPASRLRTLETIHLATFHELRRVEPGLRMLTFDERLQREL